jgi:hypothetical protein
MRDDGNPAQRVGPAWRYVPRVAAVLVPLALAALAAAPEAAAQGPGRDADCAVCHGELELLRQHVPGLTRARELLVTPGDVHGSAHDGMACAECHTGYRAFPHPQAAATASCASCHGEAERAWNAGRHAEVTVGGERAAECATCHGVHRMAPVAALAEGQEMLRVNARCVSCHQTDGLPEADPHAGQVGCWTCHAAHEVHAVDDPRSAIAPVQQVRTCGVCHDTAAVNWRTDAHGMAVLSGVTAGTASTTLPVGRETPVCTGCHLGHEMVTAETPGFAVHVTERCAVCHEAAAGTFYGSYHGRATALGSRVSAACHACHASHGVFPEDDPRSTVHPANLEETCAQCHERVTASFIKYDNHPNPFDRERNPWIFFAFVFMNAMLAGVLGVFGIHTVLWWIRLLIDRRRGHGHGHHPHAGHPGEEAAP